MGRLRREWDFGHCEDGEEKVSSGFFPVLYMLSLLLCITVYSFVWLSICNVPQSPCSGAGVQCGAQMVLPEIPLFANGILC